MRATLKFIRRHLLWFRLEGLGEFLESRRIHQSPELLEVVK